MFTCLMLFVNNGMYDNRIYGWPMLSSMSKLRWHIYQDPSRSDYEYWISGVIIGDPNSIIIAQVSVGRRHPTSLHNAVKLIQTTLPPFHFSYSSLANTKNLPCNTIRFQSGMRASMSFSSTHIRTIHSHCRRISCVYMLSLSPHHYIYYVSS